MLPELQPGQSVTLGLTRHTHKRAFQEQQRYHSRLQIITSLTQNLTFKDTQVSWPITSSFRDLPDLVYSSNAFSSVVPSSSLSWWFAEFDSPHSNGCSTVKQKITWFTSFQPSSFQKLSDIWLWRKYTILTNSLSSLNLSSAGWFCFQKEKNTYCCW